MIHYTTSNTSAIKLSYILNDMGVRNNKFFLELKNPKLINIDPFNPNLTNVEKASIIKEIIDNPWYFIREIVRIPSGGSLVQFEFHRGNLALIWAVLNDISCFLVWPRQTYKTWTMYCVYCMIFYWASVQNKICFIAQEDSIVKKNLQGVKDVRDNLPSWLNMLDKKDRDNEKEMYNVSNSNRIICKSPARNEDGARKSGRGLSTPEQWFDEAAFINYIDQLYDSISFAYAHASKAAAENGAHYHQIMTTTAGFLNTNEGRWAYNFLNSCADFNESFYDIDIKVVKTIIENTSLSGFLDLSFMYYDLGKDENYLEEQKRRLVNSPTPKDTLDREVLNKWKDISTEHPLGQDRIEKLNGLSKKPKDFIIINDTYSMRIYVDIDEFDWSKPLIGGMDLGGSLRGDFSVLTILDPTDFSVVGVMRTNSQSTTLFAFAIISIMTDLCKNLILFPERNYNGAIIDNIVSHLPNSKRRVYHEDPIRAGLFNSKKVRPILFNVILRLAVDEYGDRINDKNIISEIEGLIRTRSGKIDHKPGNHDDTLVSYLLALYFLLYVEDVGKYIDKGLILSKYDKGDMIGLRPSGMKDDNKKNDKMKRIMGSDYTKLIENNKEVSSLDDIADIMMNKFNQNTTINSSLDLYSGDNNLDSIEESDNLSEVRSSIEKMKQKNTENVKQVHIEDVGDSTDINRKGFKDFFGW